MTTVHLVLAFVLGVLLGLMTFFGWFTLTVGRASAHNKSRYFRIIRWQAFNAVVAAELNRRIHAALLEGEILRPSAKHLARLSSGPPVSPYQ